MLKKFLVLVLLPVALMIGFIACEGPEGPAGPAGAAGNDGQDGSDFQTYSYLGDNANKCGHCHGENAEQWAETGHHDAYADLAADGDENNPYCLHCHTVGWDSPVAFGDTTIATYGPDKSGFDDYWGKEDAESMARMDMLKGVQCENCHGKMGNTIYDHAPINSMATRMEDGVELSLCASCHEGQLEQWKESTHANVIANLDPPVYDTFANEHYAECGAECHTGNGFVAFNDHAYAGVETEKVLIGCAACHDPHSDANEAHLRNVGDYTVLYDVNDAAKMTGKGAGQLCVQCHHARRDAASVESQLTRGSGHIGPHGSPQMDMFLGSGCPEVDTLAGAPVVYDRGQTMGHVVSVAEACVSCHMTEVEEHGRMKRNHSNEPAIETCTTVCHPAATDFDINGRQTEIEGLVADLTAALGDADTGSADGSTREQKLAAYTLAFVNNDGSRGVHNYRYAKSLLTNAIAKLAE